MAPVSFPFVARCKKCNEVLFSNITFITAHKEINNYEGKGSNCFSDKNLLFLEEDNLPYFVNNEIERGNGTKGKIGCPNCQAKIGSFNYVEMVRCSCGDENLPPIQIISSKIDILHKDSRTVR